MSIVLDGTAGITTPEITSAGGPLVVNASAPNNSVVVDAGGAVLMGTPTSPSSNNMRLSIAGRSGSASNGGMQLITDGGGGGALFSNDGAGLRIFSFTGAAGSESYTERARIDSSGNLLVGTTSAPTLGGNTAGKFAVVNGTAQVGLQDNGDGGIFASYSTTKSIGLTAGASYGTGAGYAYIKLTPTTSNTASVVVVSNTNGVSLSNGGTSWGSLSDERKKDIIEPIVDAASKVASLRAVIGKYKTDTEGTRRAFLIAQDVRDVLPEAVTEQEDEDKTLLLQYTEVIPLLVAAIKELKAINDAQAQTINAQQAALESLTARVAALENQIV